MRPSGSVLRAERTLVWVSRLPVAALPLRHSWTTRTPAAPDDPPGLHIEEHDGLGHLADGLFGLTRYGLRSVWRQRCALAASRLVVIGSKVWLQGGSGFFKQHPGSPHHPHNRTAALHAWLNWFCLSCGCLPTAALNGWASGQSFVTQIPLAPTPLAYI